MSADPSDIFDDDKLPQINPEVRSAVADDDEFDLPSQVKDSAALEDDDGADVRQFSRTATANPEVMRLRESMKMAEAEAAATLQDADAEQEEWETAKRDKAEAARLQRERWQQQQLKIMEEQKRAIQAKEAAEAEARMERRRKAEEMRLAKIRAERERLLAMKRRQEEARLEAERRKLAERKAREAARLELEERQRRLQEQEEALRREREEREAERARQEAAKAAREAERKRLRDEELAREREAKRRQLEAEQQVWQEEMDALRAKRQAEEANRGREVAQRRKAERDAEQREATARSLRAQARHLAREEEFMRNTAVRNMQLAEMWELRAQENARSLALRQALEEEEERKENERLEGLRKVRRKPANPEEASSPRSTSKKSKPVKKRKKPKMKRAVKKKVAQSEPGESKTAVQRAEESAVVVPKSVAPGYYSKRGMTKRQARLLGLPMEEPSKVASHTSSSARLPAIHDFSHSGALRPPPPPVPRVVRKPGAVHASWLDLWAAGGAPVGAARKREMELRAPRYLRTPTKDSAPKYSPTGIVRSLSHASPPRNSSLGRTSSSVNALHYRDDYALFRRTHTPPSKPQRIPKASRSAATIPVDDAAYQTKRHTLASPQHSAHPGSPVILPEMKTPASKSQPHFRSKPQSATPLRAKAGTYIFTPDGRVSQSAAGFRTAPISASTKPRTTSRERWQKWYCGRVSSVYASPPKHSTQSRKRSPHRRNGPGAHATKTKTAHSTPTIDGTERDNDSSAQEIEPFQPSMLQSEDATTASDPSAIHHDEPHPDPDSLPSNYNDPPEANDVPSAEQDSAARQTVKLSPRVSASAPHLPVYNPGETASDDDLHPSESGSSLRKVESNLELSTVVRDADSADQEDVDASTDAPESEASGAPFESSTTKLAPPDTASVTKEVVGNDVDENSLCPETDSSETLDDKSSHIVSDKADPELFEDFAVEHGNVLDDSKPEDRACFGVSMSNFPKLDTYSKSDPQIIALVGETEIGRTEFKVDDHDPVFEQGITVPGDVAEDAVVRLHVVEMDQSANSVGNVEIPLSDLCESKEPFVYQIRQSDGEGWVRGADGTPTLLCVQPGQLQGIPVPTSGKALNADPDDMLEAAPVDTQPTTSATPPDEQGADSIVDPSASSKPADNTFITTPDKTHPADADSSGAAEPLRTDVADTTPSPAALLGVSISNFPKLDTYSKSDPQIIALVGETEIGRTEFKVDDHDPVFEQGITVPGDVAEDAVVRLHVVEMDQSANSVGNVEIPLSELCESKEPLVYQVARSDGAGWVRGNDGEATLLCVQPGQVQGIPVPRRAVPRNVDMQKSRRGELPSSPIVGSFNLDCKLGDEPSTKGEDSSAGSLSTSKLSRLTVSTPGELSLVEESKSRLSKRKSKKKKSSRRSRRLVQWDWAVCEAPAPEERAATFIAQVRRAALCVYAKAEELTEVDVVRVLCSMRKRRRFQRKWAKHKPSTDCQCNAVETAVCTHEQEYCLRQLCSLLNSKKDVLVVTSVDELDALVRQ